MTQGVAVWQAVQLLTFQPKSRELDNADGMLALHPWPLVRSNECGTRQTRDNNNAMWLPAQTRMTQPLTKITGFSNRWHLALLGITSGRVCGSDSCQSFEVWMPEIVCNEQYDGRAWPPGLIFTFRAPSSQSHPSTILGTSKMPFSGF